jgi:hypothetical protein
MCLIFIHAYLPQYFIYYNIIFTITVKYLVNPPKKNVNSDRHYMGYLLLLASGDDQPRYKYIFLIPNTIISKPPVGLPIRKKHHLP